jgi:uncharacterized protein YjbI with pentapeptide repeats
MMTVVRIKAVASPLPPQLAAYEPYDATTQEDSLFEQQHIVDVHKWPLMQSARWRFDTCKLEQCTFVGQGVSNASFWDSVLVRCDISACKMFDAGILRSELLGCRATGLQLGESTIKDVSFQNCKLNMVSFRKCKLTRVVFENCILDDADFNDAVLTDVLFTKCELNRTEFSGSKSFRVDMTRSSLLTIRGVKSLRNVRISSEQMMDLAPLLCAEIGLVLDAPSG